MLTTEVLAAGAAACVTVLGAIRLSRCTRIKCCCVECERRVVDADRVREAYPGRGGEESPSEDEPEEPERYGEGAEKSA